MENPFAPGANSEAQSSHVSNTLLEKDAFPRLTVEEWLAFGRMAKVIGEAGVVNILRNSSPDDQRRSVTAFLHQEVMSSREQQRLATPVTQTRIAPLKIDVSTYKGSDAEPLLRWFVELDAAIQARQLTDARQQVTFAMSKLGGRAKSWAFGRRLSDPYCFSTYEEFKNELKLAFEPPKCEFRARAEFLDLRQSKTDLHSYAQRARYLVSSIVSEPIDVATQVVTFMKGLDDGPIKTQLFREYPSTLDEAISLALQEEFSLKQAIHHALPSRSGPTRPSRPPSPSEPEPMDLSAIPSNAVESNHPHRCFRCDRPGHIAKNCYAKTVSRPQQQRARPNTFRGQTQGRAPQAKNDKAQ
ncbi:hypothetical protein Poli38472_012231 [Pythium oligandrum]|uniref:CCHC-type domain-containing protein n=1 Tax=Pythium oligandrum TaxID=41045 RepID=A0A8K1CQZ2_PYTOL|nr:hypothetical protein Poli38472_012229 [Pythium oligandrum]TMW67115.1 hypothetical protein Poli38472_012231 [Pythium oligandrum]|eukprot:TMW67113.1 hypothetical protein Poli38472_012229 [Pythium oligandrum]